MNRRVRMSLALLALVVGTFAAIAGAPQRPLAVDEISAQELATAIRARRPRLLIVDLRPPAAGTRDRLPGAGAVVDANLDAADTIVVYTDRDVDAGAIESLPQLRARTILRLRGGFQAWNDEVLFPVLRSDAGEQQQRDFATRAELSRYFGGSPRVLVPGEARVRSRRGC